MDLTRERVDGGGNGVEILTDARTVRANDPIRMVARAAIALTPSCNAGSTLRWHGPKR
jgi:hypothetical protein